MRNIIYNQNIIEPSEELVPVIRIAPFSNKYLYRKGASAKKIDECKTYLHNRFGRYVILPKVRSCIEECIKYYNLSSEDVITILTSSGNRYVSSCVTRPMERYCKWSRVIVPETKVLFIIHEFGYPYKDWNRIENLGIPIIEDCAYAYGTEDSEIGKHGDFILYSLPKFFPMQMGAIMKTNVPCNIVEDEKIREYVLNSLSQEYRNEEFIKKRRISNFNYLTKRLSSIGIHPFFKRTEGVVPGTYIFTWDNEVDYPSLRKFMESNGIECSVFYGRNAFFIPMNHNLTRKDLDYMVDLLNFYAENYLLA